MARMNAIIVANNPAVVPVAMARALGEGWTD